MKPVRPPDAPSLRHNYLSSIEDAAQALGGMAPTGTMGVILPLLIARGGNASWLSFLFILVAFSLIFFCVNRFAQHFASAGSFATYAEESLGATAGAIAGWAYVLAMCYGMSGTAPSAAYYADVFITEVTGAHGSLPVSYTHLGGWALHFARIAWREPAPFDVDRRLVQWGLSKRLDGRVLKP